MTAYLGDAVQEQAEEGEEDDDASDVEDLAAAHAWLRTAGLPLEEEKREQHKAEFLAKFGGDLPKLPWFR